ncbi:MAG: ferritin-like domain-containing protein [Actinomycetota bacterium]|nr:ferritin-like domain-containing protein [Actinomycetota bacterium]
MDGAEGRALPVEFDREHSRRNFLKTAAWATAAISAAGIGGFGVATRYAEAQAAPYTTYQGLGDAAILQFAYLLEQLEGTFYAIGADSGIFTGNALAQVAELRDHEFAHADALASTITTLGAAVPAVPEFTYPQGVFADPAAFLQLANTFEPVGIGAYQGAAPALVDKNILAAALSIHAAECQHWNSIKILNGISPPNNVALEEALPLGAVQQAVAPFGITG